MLLECLTGQYPFNASEGPMELVIHVSVCCDESQLLIVSLDGAGQIGPRERPVHVLQRLLYSVHQQHALLAWWSSLRERAELTDMFGGDRLLCQRCGDADPPGRCHTAAPRLCQ